MFRRPIKGVRFGVQRPDASPAPRDDRLVLVKLPGMRPVEITRRELRQLALKEVNAFPTLREIKSLEGIEQAIMAIGVLPTAQAREGAIRMCLGDIAELPQTMLIGFARQKLMGLLKKFPQQVEETGAMHVLFA